jgi:very-short-patch-repair endonuclease
MIIGVDRWLRNEGFTVLRFWNNEVLGNTEAALESIRETVLSLNVTT